MCQSILHFSRSSSLPVAKSAINSNTACAFLVLLSQTRSSAYLVITFISTTGYLSFWLRSRFNFCRKVSATWPVEPALTGAETIKRNTMYFMAYSWTWKKDKQKREMYHKGIQLLDQMRSILGSFYIILFKSVGGYLLGQTIKVLRKVTREE